MVDLGLLLQEGLQDARGRAIVRRNPRAGFRLLLRSAVNGNTSAALPLGYAYDVGLGTRRDKRQAFRWYHRASLLPCSSPRPRDPGRHLPKRRSGPEPEVIQW